MARYAICMFLCLISQTLPSGFGTSQETQPAEFFFTRLIYRSYGRAGGLFVREPAGRGGNAWMTDFPEADHKFMWGVQRMTNIRLHMEDNPHAILDPDLFKFPFVYAVEVGQMVLSQDEADRMREYLLRGGFWYCDDFWGVDQFRSFALQMQKVFPDRPLEKIPLTDEVFHTFFDVTIMQIPNIGNARQISRGNPYARTWQDPSDITPGVFGIRDDSGRIMVLVTYNSDLGDAWEWMDDPEYPEYFSGQAYRMGMNFIIYAMTH